MANSREKCMGRSFVVRGGSECTEDGRHIEGGVLGSKHRTDQAFDMRIWGMQQYRDTIFCCALKCGAKYVKDESKTKKPHWHFQTTEGQYGVSGDLPTEEDCKCIIEK